MVSVRTAQFCHCSTMAGTGCGYASVKLLFRKVDGGSNWNHRLQFANPDLKLQKHSERINWLYGIDNKGILYFIMICKLVLYILQIHKIYNKYYMSIYIFIGNLVVKYLPVHHSSQPTSFTKSVIHAALSLLSKPLLSAHHIPDTRDERMRKMKLVFSKSSQSSERDQETTGKMAEDSTTNAETQPKCCAAERIRKPTFTAAGDSTERSGLNRHSNPIKYMLLLPYHVWAN